MDDWREELKLEFERAAQAREKKNEGQARVCARRAAGIAIRESLTRRGTPATSASAIDLLHQIESDATLPADVRKAADHLTMRVTESFTLPVEVDLVAEARALCKWLLPEWE